MSATALQLKGCLQPKILCPKRTDRINCSRMPLQQMRHHHLLDQLRVHLGHQVLVYLACLRHQSHPLVDYHHLCLQVLLVLIPYPTFLLHPHPEGLVEGHLECGLLCRLHLVLEDQEDRLVCVCLGPLLAGCHLLQAITEEDHHVINMGDLNMVDLMEVLQDIMEGLHTVDLLMVDHRMVGGDHHRLDGVLRLHQGITDMEVDLVILHGLHIIMETDIKSNFVSNKFCTYLI